MHGELNEMDDNWEHFRVQLWMDKQATILISLLCTAAFPTAVR